MLGKEVNRIVDNTMAAGTFKATWKGDAQNGEKVPSGVYFYRIQAGSFSAAKKMLMLK
jgi:flagellar hook assembly protein FlgD